MSFVYPFLNFLQPGALWIALADYRPMLVASVLVGLLSLRRSVRPESKLLHGYFRHPAVFWLSVFVVVQAISVYYSGVSSVIQEFGVWQVYLMFLVVSLLTIRDPATLKRYIWGAIVGAGFVVFYGLYAVAVHAPTIVEGRAGAYGMYENQNDYSFIILMVLPFAYLYLRICRTLWQRLMLLALLVGCGVGMLLSLSRGGILAMVLESALIVWLTLRGKRRFVVLVALGLIATVAVVHQFVAREENQAGQYTEADSETSRYELWRAARAAFYAHPALGVGSRRFSEYASRYAPISHDNRGKVAHNTYLEVAADTGLAGLIPFGFLLFAILKPLRTAKFADLHGDGVAEAKLAALIAFYTFVFRAMLDAKLQDWTLYFIAVVAVATSVLPKKTASDAAALPRLRTRKSEATARLTRPMPST